MKSVTKLARLACVVASASAPQLLHAADDTLDYLLGATADGARLQRRPISLHHRPALRRRPSRVGYANLWVAFGFTPGALLVFFKGGAFAWNGLIGFWIVALCFFGWIILMWWATVRAIRNEPESEAAITA